MSDRWNRDQPRERLESTAKQQPRANGVGNGWMDDVEERAAIFQQLEASPEFAARQAPERLARLPRREKLFPIEFVYAYVVISMLLGCWLVILDPADQLQRFALTVIGIAAFGILLFGTVAAIVIYRRGDSGTVDRADVACLPAIVTGKKWAGENCYYASFMNSEGECFEHLLWSKRLAERFYTGDAGILFVWNDKAISFDRVLTSQVIIESHVEGAVECLYCEAVYRLGSVPANCANCGADLHAVMSTGPKVARTFVSTIFAAFRRWSDNNLIRAGQIRDVATPSLKERVEGSISCGWCRHRHEVRPESPNCQSCGGVLPMPAGDPGPKPPQTPRQFPRPFAFDLFWGRQVQLKIGLLVFVFGIGITFVFPPMGFMLLFIGTLGSFENVIASWRRWQAWSRGVAVLGRIDRIQCVEGAVYTSDKQYDEYSVYFRFQADGLPVRGMTFSFEPATANHFLGERVWIVYVPDKPHLCAIWPPLT